MAIKVAVVGTPNISRALELSNSNDVVLNSLIETAKKSLVFEEPLNTWFGNYDNVMSWDCVTSFKHISCGVTSLHDIRYKLAKRNCKGRQRTGRAFNNGTLFKIGCLRRNDPMRSFNFIKWDKVTCLPNHFLGGRRR